MGLFDLFRKSPARQPEGYVIPDAAEASRMGEMRRQHYEYAHRVLPAVAFSNPQRAVSALTAPTAREFLGALWAAAGDRAEEAGGTADRSFRPPEPFRRVIDRVAWYVMALPQPRIMPEAFLVALAMKPAPVPGEWEVRCFTLELTVNMETQRATTVLCGWSPGGRHSNYGVMDCPPDPEAFLNACLKLEAESV